jgi:hypothetical protein
MVEHGTPVIVMGRWMQGQRAVERLLADRHLQQVVADADTVAALLQAAARHVTTAESAVEDDPEGAYSLAYDAARKAATALLAHQGLRPTSAGGHIAVVETVRAQFPKVPGLVSLDRLRRRRNQSEYPQPSSYDPIEPEEATDAVTVARHCLTSARRLLELDQLGVF